MRATFGTVPRTAFTLVELLVSISIITALTAFLVPTLRNAHDQALRVQCASNLRQIGLIETSYAVENGGWLLLRQMGHPGTARNITPFGSGCLAKPLSKYTSAGVWFCPGTHNRLTSDLLSDADRTSLLSANMTGYAFYGACWSGTGPLGPTEPVWGPIGQRINANARKISQLTADMVRASEYWEPTLPMGGTGGSEAGLPNHYDRRGYLSGGNMLMGDGSVRWSSYGYKYYAGDLYVYVMPEELRSTP